MSGTLRVFRAEAYRLAASRATWLVGAFLALVAALRVVAARASEAVSGAEAVAAGRELAPAASGSGWLPLVQGWRAGLIATTLLLLVHAARSLAADREAGVLRLAATRSVRRPALVLGRALVAPLVVVGAFLFTGLAAWATAASFYDFGPLVEDGYELLGAGELADELARASLSALPALFGVYAFGLLVSAASRGATGAVGAALSLFLVFDLFKEELGEGRHWVFAAYAPSFVDGSAMNEMVGIAQGFSDAGYPDALFAAGRVLPTAEGVACVLLACLLLSRRAL